MINIPEKYASDKKIVPDYALYRTSSYEGNIKSIYDRARKVFARTKNKAVAHDEAYLTDGVIDFEPCSAEGIAELAYLCTLGTNYDARVFSNERELEKIWRKAFNNFAVNKTKQWLPADSVFSVPDESNEVHREMRQMRNMCYQAMEQGADNALRFHAASGFQTNWRMGRMRKYMENMFDEVYHIPWHPPQKPVESTENKKTKSGPGF